MPIGLHSSRPPYHICNATQGESEDSEHGEFIAGWYGLLPGDPFGVIEHHSTQKDESDDEKSRIENAMPGRKEGFQLKAVMSPGIEIATSHRPGTGSYHHPIKRDSS